MFFWSSQRKFEKMQMSREGTRYFYVNTECKCSQEFSKYYYAFDYLVEWSDLPCRWKRIDLLFDTEQMIPKHDLLSGYISCNYLRMHTMYCNLYHSSFFLKNGMTSEWSRDTKTVKQADGMLIIIGLTLESSSNHQNR